MSLSKNINHNTDLTLYAKFNSKWITELKVKCKTMKFLGENIGENLCDLGFGNKFLDTRPKTIIYERKKVINETSTN